MLPIHSFSLVFIFWHNIKGVFSARLFQNLEDLGVPTGPNPLRWSYWRCCLSFGSWYSQFFPLCWEDRHQLPVTGYPQMKTVPASSSHMQALPPVTAHAFPLSAYHQSQGTNWSFSYILIDFYFKSKGREFFKEGGRQTASGKDTQEASSMIPIFFSKKKSDLK